jgi:hypothetical protein
MATRNKTGKKGKKPKSKKSTKKQKKGHETIGKKEKPILTEDDESETKPIPEDEELLFERP